ncbi:MAG: GAF domain-containing protein, partial [Anaerolineales bacterium]
MTTLLRNFWQNLMGQSRDEPPPAVIPVADRSPRTVPALEIAPNDPLVAYFQGYSSVVEVDKLNLNSPALRGLKAAGVKMVVPLVSQGELIGLLNLGPRLSEQDYSTDDRALLNNLASQAT